MARKTDRLTKVLGIQANRHAVRMRRSFPDLVKAERNNDRRARRLRSLRDGEDFPDGAPDPVTRVAVGDAWDRLRVVHADAASVLSFTAAGYSADDIAAKMDLSLRRVEKLQHYGRSILKALLELP